MTRRPFMIGSGLLFLTILCMAQSAPPSTRPNSITGTWRWDVPGSGGQAPTILKLVDDGRKVTGRIGGAGGEDLAIQEGVYKDGKLTFKTVRDANGQKMVTTFTASLHADA